MCLQSHYRKQLVFTYEGLDNASNAYEKLKQKIKSLKEDTSGNIENYEVYLEEFKKQINDDLNTASALTVLYDVLKSELNSNTKLFLIEKFDQVLSLDLLKEELNDLSSEKIKYINEMIEKRNDAKKNKDFLLADEIRNSLLKDNIILNDTREGTTYEIKK
jgi:cysteinyl-tRNA synthetase